MRSIVCVKRVPDTAAKIEVDGSGNVDTEGIEYVASPYDEFALEEAVQKKEEAEEGEVVVLSLGGEDTEKTIRECLARGADRGIHLQTDEEEWDPHATAEALARAISNLDVDYDVLWFGKHAVDDDGYQVGQIVAAKLNLPVTTSVASVEAEADRLVCERERGGGIEVIPMPYPCVVTAEKSLNEPRYAKLQNIMKAKKKELDQQEVESVPTSYEVVDRENPPERPPGEIIGEGPEAVEELVRALREDEHLI